MAQCTKILLFLLFEHQHLVTNLVLSEQPINQHEVLPYIEQEGVGLCGDRST